MQLYSLHRLSFFYFFAINVFIFEMYSKQTDIKIENIEPFDKFPCDWSAKGGDNLSVHFGWLLDSKRGQNLTLASDPKGWIWNDSRTTTQGNKQERRAKSRGICSLRDLTNVLRQVLERTRIGQFTVRGPHTDNPITSRIVTIFE